MPALFEILLHEPNVAEFGGTFAGVAYRIPYLISLADATSHVWVPIPGHFGGLFRLDG